jgi:hypothetical protein
LKREPGLGLGEIFISLEERARAWLEERSPSHLKREPGL